MHGSHGMIIHELGRGRIGGTSTHRASFRVMRSAQACPENKKASADSASDAAEGEQHVLVGSMMSPITDGACDMQPGLRLHCGWCYLGLHFSIGIRHIDGGLTAQHTHARDGLRETQ